MTNQAVNKFIHSSLFLAFMTITGIATAYCYGWGQAFSYGYPWWHVEIGQAIVARSVAYVFLISLLLFIGYAIGYKITHSIFKMGYFEKMGWLRVFILVSVFTIPILFVFYLFFQHIPLYLAVIYIITTILSILLFQHHWNHQDLKLDFRKMFKEEYLWLFNIFIFLYFCILALSVGYLRPELRATYDHIQVNGQFYYILSTNSDNSYIMATKPRENDEFIFFNRDSQKIYRIQVVKIPH